MSLKNKLPSPLEVDRFISLIAAKTEVERLKLPSPLEVDWSI